MVEVLLILRRGKIAHRFEQAVVVEPPDPFERREFNSFEIARAHGDGSPRF